LKERPLVRASDIGLWTFCQRAWWLARVRGVEHQRPAVLAKGVAMHQAHGRQLQHAQWQMTLGRGLLALGMIGAGLILLLAAIQRLL